MAPMGTAPTAPWNPVKVLNLDIAQVREFVRCHGKAQTQHRCKHTISSKWHGEIEEAVRLLKLRAPQDLKVRDLEPLANSLLCKQSHRGSQEQELAAKWWHLLQRFLQQDASAQHQTGIKKENVVTQLAYRAAAAEQRANEHLALTHEAGSMLAEAQSRLSSEKSAGRKLSLENQTLKLKLAKIEGEHALEIVQLRTELGAAYSTCTEMTKHHDKEMAEMKKRLQTERQNSEEEMVRQHEEKLAKVKAEHEEKTATAQTQLSETTQSLQAKTSEARKKTQQIVTLEREKQLRSAKITSLEESAKQNRIQEGFRTIRLQLQLRMWQRHSEGLQADNQTLMETQRQLQHQATGYGQELHSLQDTLRPLKLNDVKKGLHTVFSVRPMRVRALRIST